MTFLAPGFLVAAGLLAAGVVAIHFIVTREPRTVPLPTARFAPERPVRATARRMQLSDILLMLLRVLLILAVGAALARPVMDPPRRDVAGIVLVDRSRAIADPAEVIDSANSILRDGDALVLFDSAAVTVTQGARDSLAVLTASSSPGALSAALIAALRSASELRDRADSLEMVLVSPMSADAIDAATDSIRALWPADIRIVKVSARADSAARAPRIMLTGADDDPLQYAYPDSVLTGTRDEANVIVMRGADVDTTPLGAAVNVVHWPATHDSDTTAVPLPQGWEALATPDTIGGLTVGGVSVVAAFERTARYASEDGRVVARWSDGKPAAVEVTSGDGCFRSAVIPVPAAGDLVLQRRFRQIAAALAGPCMNTATSQPLDSANIAALAGATERRFAASATLSAPEHTPTPLVPWLLAAALVFAAGTLLLQRPRNAPAGGEA